MGDFFCLNFTFFVMNCELEVYALGEKFDIIVKIKNGIVLPHIEIRRLFFWKRFIVRNQLLILHAR